MKEVRFLNIGTTGEVITDSNLEAVYDIKVMVFDAGTGIIRKICVPIEDCRSMVRSENDL
jgi:hypothetical protein